MATVTVSFDCDETVRILPVHSDGDSLAVEQGWATVYFHGSAKQIRRVIDAMSMSVQPAVALIEVPGCTGGLERVHEPEPIA